MKTLGVMSPATGSIAKPVTGASASFTAASCGIRPRSSARRAAPSR